MRIVLGILAVIAALLAAAYVHLSLPDISRATLEAKYGLPPSKFLTLSDGARVHYRDEGPRDGSALVLLHGSNAALFTWVPWVDRLDKTFRVVTFDLPGHGLTGPVPSNDYSQKGMESFVDKVVDKLGLAKFALAGNSMGGAIAARYAEDHPDRVVALILVDAGGMAVRNAKLPLGFRIARTPVLNRLLVHVTPRRLFAEGLYDAFADPSKVTPAMIDEYWELNRMRGSREATMERFQLPWDDYVATHIAQIKAPTLILWGAKDRVIPVAAAHEYAAAIPGSKLVIFPQAGHVLQEDDPDDSAAALRTFLTSLRS